MLSYCVVVSVLCIILALPWVGLCSVLVAFPDITHLFKYDSFQLFSFPKLFVRAPMQYILNRSLRILFWLFYIDYYKISIAL